MGRHGRFLPGLLLTAVLPLAACDNSADDDDTTDPDLPDPYDPDDPTADWDGDGYPTAEDCNDFDAAVHPDQVEVCGNGLDDDCNSAIDCEDPACASGPDCEPEEPISELCGDGIDNDEDGATDCDDEDCVYSFYCSPCAIQVAGTCGTTWHVFAVYPTANTAAYACDGANETGPEVVYEFLPYADGVVEFHVDPEDPLFTIGGNDVNIYVMEGVCHPDKCIDYSASAGLGDVESVSVNVTAGTYYYVAVEDVGGSDADFDFSTNCF